MKKLTATILLGFITLALISSCSQKSIHTSKDRPESFIEFVQED